MTNGLRKQDFGESVQKVESIISSLPAGKESRLRSLSAQLCGEKEVEEGGEVRLCQKLLLRVGGGSRRQEDGQEYEYTQDEGAEG